MHEKQLKTAAAKAVMAMLIIVAGSFYMTKYNNMKLYASPRENPAKMENSIKENFIPGEEEYVNFLTGEKVKEIEDRYIKIEKLSSDPIKITIEDLYMERKIKVTLDNLSRNLYNKDSVSSSEEAFTMDKVFLETIYNPDKFTYCSEFEISLDSIYVPTIYEKDDGFYIELKNPKDVYDKIVVIDAGHGGDDIGTYAMNKEYVEKDINQNVVNYLKEMLDKNQNIKAYYTRLQDEKVYLNPRVNLANDLDADLFLSVHCNGMNDISAKGTEVLYGYFENSTGKISSKKFAEFALEDLTFYLGTKKRGVLKENNIYILGNSKVPTALVELGFMSNSEDMELLKKKETQKKAAESLYSTIIRTFIAMKEEKQ
ncbi:MAG: N-acetylmuramoyl-L-alanine amidase [Acetivibrio sp.]